MPLFSQKKLPAAWKVAVGVLFTIILMPLLTPVPYTLNLVWLVFAVLWEVVLGMSFGMVLTTAVGAALSAGSLVDLQMGFANAGILNPGGGQQPEPLIASFFKMIILLASLIGSFHLALVRLLLESFHWFPVGSLLHRFDDLTRFGMALVGKFFVSVIWLVLPLCLTLLAAEVCIAFLSRLMPQMNMLISAAPVRVLAGFAVVTMTLPLTLRTMSAVLESHFSLVSILHG